MQNLKTIEQKVRAILELDADARNDDMTLYVRICDTYIKGISHQKMNVVLLQYKLLGLPNFESVSRIRRKLQANYPELMGSTRIQQNRTEQERVYRVYCKE